MAMMTKKVKLRKKSGFTLIELMVVVTILAMMTVVSTQLFFRAIRGSGQAEGSIRVEQNAQLVISLLERAIINAQSVKDVGGGSCPGSGDNITLVNWDGGESNYNLTAEGRIASNSAVISSPAVVITNLVFECVRVKGVPDSISISFTADRASVEEGAENPQLYEANINLRNF